MNRDSILKLIIDNFKNKKFTTGDIYYSFYDSFNRSKFGEIRNIIVSLTKENVLSYKIETRGSPNYDSDRNRTGAVYMLK